MAELTIAFVDLTGSVSVFETLGNDRAAKAVTKLTQWIGSMGLEHNGKVVKMLGDGVLLPFQRRDERVRVAATGGQFEPGFQECVRFLLRERFQRQQSAASGDHGETLKLLQNFGWLGR